MKAFMYIFHRSGGYYCTASTHDLERRMEEHLNGQGANFTGRHLPVKLL